MKKFLTILAVLTGIIVPVMASAAVNFGDYRSETLATKAWGALAQGDTQAVLAYTNKCLELYAEQAKKMQDSLTDYPKGDNEKVFSYWALNDVATSLFIQGEALRRANMEEEAVVAFKKIISDYSYGQCWDSNGWFWKPAEAAKEKLAMIDSGLFLDFGDYSSSFMATQAWKAFEDNKLDAVLAYTNKVIELYAEKAKEMQASLTEYPWQSREQIFKYWALNDVGTSYYIQGEALKKAGKIEDAKKAYSELIKNYFYAQCWDPKGWFWKPSEGAQEALDALGEVKK
ncbi:MAG: tetratricopeptide repeat protein [Candidatus Omnitrophica bacterium]|nr:tetratricopeptide repeat protein [Candidatus Omnitrophota bacterium]